MAFVRVHLSIAAPGCLELPGSDLARWRIIPEPTPAQVIWFIAELLQVMPNHFALVEGGEIIRGGDKSQTKIFARAWDLSKEPLQMALVWDGMSFDELKRAHNDVTTSLKSKAA